MIVAADPGQTTALAVYMGPTPGVTSIDSLTPEVAYQFLAWAKGESATRDEELVVVVEDQFAKIRWVKAKGKRKRDEKLTPKIDLPALISVVRSAEIWVVCAGLLGIRVVRVKPSVWQGPMFKGAPEVDEHGRDLDTKGKARHVVAATWSEVYRFAGIPESDSMKLVKVARLNEHIRDAMLMGRWYQLHGAREGR